VGPLSEDSSKRWHGNFCTGAFPVKAWLRLRQTARQGSSCGQEDQ
jgi:hypothetical protein